MPIQHYFQQLQIGGKDVYIVDDHHKALAPWALIRRTVDHASNLITIDHHTDVYEAFLRHAHQQTMSGNGDTYGLSRTLVKKIDFRNDQSLEWAIEHLCHDEQIDAATMSDVLNYAFCIQLSDNSGNQSIEQQAYDLDRQTRWPLPPALPAPHRPMTYADPPNRIFVIPHECAIGCTRMPHNDDCVIEHGNMILESDYLDDQLVRGVEMSRCVGMPNLEALPYILDIDLDAFHSRRAIAPADPSTFYRLIRNARALTVATEAQCVDELKFDDEPIDAEMLLERLLEHIEVATANGA